MTTPEETPTAPVLRVVKGDPSAEELAALVAVVATAGASQPAAPAHPVREWNNPYRQVRPFYSQGPGGWRSSGLPKHRGRGN